MENQVRGLTTAGLLHLAAQIIQNSIYAQTGKTVKNLREEIQKQIPGLPLPARVGVKAMKDLKKADWINGGNATDAWRAKNVSGQELERYRQVLYDFVGTNAGYLFDQRFYPAVHVPGSPAGTPKVANKASSLDELWAGSNYRLADGVDEKGKAKYRHPNTFEERLQGVRALWAATQRDTEPGVRQVSARGGFQRGPADQNQALAAINGGTYGGKVYPATNGFVVEKLAEFLAAKVSAKDPAVTPAANATPQQIQAIVQTNARLAQLHQQYKTQMAPVLAGTQPNTPAKDVKAAILALGKNPAALHARVVALNTALGGRLADTLWDIASTTRIGNVLSGYNISKPQIGVKPKVGTEKDVANREWVWLPDVQADGSNPVGNPVGYTRFVFNALMQAYLQRGAAGNSQGYVEASSSRGAARGSKGIRGPNDKSLDSLDFRSDKGKKKVATFVRNAVQHQYHMDALLKGAQLLGIPVDATATLPETVIAQIREGVVKNLGPLADQGDQWALRAVGAALGMTGTFGAADIRAKIDAKHGIMSSNDCNSYTNEDLKHIAKGANVTLKGKTKEEDCRELQALAAQNKLATQGAGSISGRRGNAPSAPPKAVKARGKKKAAEEIRNLMGTGQAPALSPRTAALFGRAAQPVQPTLPVGTAFPVPTSPRQSQRGVVEINGAQLNSPRRNSQTAFAPTVQLPQPATTIPTPLLPQPTVGGGLFPAAGGQTTSLSQMLNALNTL